MLDSDTHKALSLEKAREYAAKTNIPFVESSQIKSHGRSLMSRN
jgi:hypothetical protein